MVAALKKAGAHVTYLEFPAAATPTSSCPTCRKAFEFLAAQRKGAAVARSSNPSLRAR